MKCLTRFSLPQYYYALIGTKGLGLEGVGDSEEHSATKAEDFVERTSRIAQATHGSRAVTGLQEGCTLFVFLPAPAGAALN